MRSMSRGEYKGCVLCGGSGEHVGGGVVALEEVESDVSLEEGELRNSGIESEWWERKGWGAANPVRESFKAKHAVQRPEAVTRSVLEERCGRGGHRRRFRGGKVAKEELTSGMRKEGAEGTEGKGEGKGAKEEKDGEPASKRVKLPYMGTAKPLGAHLMTATKEKIWKEEYVDILKLLHWEVKAKEGSKEEEWGLSKRPKVPVTIENWTAAF
ncbi:hypothetical protein NDU88_002284 [Pleurodeles waltl]|uniref:Uncharacterized protein n=1 Tax=Pleurodeles waltl TaxID=8319 RepID=A0AAV7LIE4_PLEWA|nr:hypothetical protein NDU88_002284 [Pleurodeles waltl]